VAITLVHTTAANSTSVTIPSTTAGNCLVVCVLSFNTTTSQSVSGVTLGGSAGNFAQAISKVGGTSSAVMAAIWVDPNCAGGQTAITISGSNLLVSFGDGGVVVFEFSGVATSSPVDLTSSGGAATGTGWDSGTTGTTSQAVEAWVGAAVGFATLSTLPGSPWTNTQPGGASNPAVAGYQITSSAGTADYAGTQTSSDPWAAVVVTLKGPPTTQQGAATLTGTGSLSALATQRPAATLTGTGSLAALAIVPGATTLAAAGSLGAAGLIVPTFPGSPPNPLGAKIELLLGGAWTDVTQYVMLRDYVSISNMGRADESGSITASQLTLTLKNDGRFTPKNTAGAYYPNIVRNCQIRVSVNAQSRTGVIYSGYRYYGEISSWPPGYDISQRDTYVQVMASGIWRRISANQAPVGSSMWRYVTQLTGLSLPAAYWAMEDGGSGTQSASPLFVLSEGTGSNLTATSAPSFAADSSSFAGSNALPQLNGARLTGTVSMAVAPSTYTIRFALAVPAAGDSSASTFSGGGQLLKVATAGTVATVSVSVVANKLVVAGLSSGGSTLFSGTINTKVNGTPVLVSYEQTGGAYALKIIALNTGTVIDQVTGSGFSWTVGKVTQVQVSPQGRFADTTFGQLHVIPLSTASSTTAAAALGGHAGEFAVDRFTRICGEFSIATTVIGSASAAMGPQVSDTLANVLQSIEDTDGGLLYETTGQFGLGYRTLGSMKDQAAAVTAGYTSGALGAPLTPTYDDQLVVNQWTVTNWDGYSALAQLTSGALSIQQVSAGGMGSGYAKSKNINASSDAQANTIAQQLMFQGTTDEVRYPSVTFNFQRTAAAPFFASVPGLRLGDYLQITSLPAFLGGSTAKQLIWGYTETIGGEIPGWRIDFNTVPEVPFETGFTPGVFSVGQAVNGAVPAGSSAGSGTVVSPSQLGPGAALPATISARTIGGTTSFIAASTPYDWTFAVTGTPADATYFTATEEQTLAIAAGDTFSNSGGLGGPFTVTSIDPPSGGLVNVRYTPDSSSVMSSGTVTGGKNGDTWVNTSAGNQVNVWVSGAWVPITWDATHIIQANTITASQIASGIVLAGVVDATTINAATITASTFDGTNFVLDGQGVKIYDASSSTLRAQVSGQSSNDPFGNQMAPGYVGSVKNWIPSSPGSIDGWNNVSAPAGWTLGINRYKNVAENNCILVDISLNDSTGGSGNVTAMTLPAAYRPGHTQSFAMWLTAPTYTALSQVPATQRITVSTSGTVTTFGLPSGTTSFGATFMMFLD
jgi:hypothetical protein